MASQVLQVWRRMTMPAIFGSQLRKPAALARAHVRAPGFVLVLFFVYVCVCVCVCGCVWCPLRGQGRPEICLKWDSGVLDRCIPQYSWCIPHRTCESRVPGGGTIQNYCRSGGNLVLPFDTLVRSGPPCSSCGCLCFRKSLTSRKMEGLRSEKKTGMHRLLCWRSDMLYWEREWA